MVVKATTKAREVAEKFPKDSNSKLGDKRPHKDNFHKIFGIKK